MASSVAQAAWETLGARSHVLGTRTAGAQDTAMGVRLTGVSVKFPWGQRRKAFLLVSFC